MAKNKSLGKELVAALKEANSYHDGKISLRTENFELPADPQVLSGKQIKKIRETLNISQPVFAKFMGVSDKAVKAWERGGSTPNGCALRLLEIAMKHPKDFFSSLLELRGEILMSSKIKHVVLLMFENGSFDRNLGCFAKIYPGRLEATLLDCAG